MVDLGAGNQVVGGLLSELGVASYEPFDLLPQSEDVTKFDASQVGPLPSGDVMFAMGLVEYLPTDCGFAQRAAEAATEVVISYVALAPAIDIAGRQDRQWVRHQTEAEFVDEFLAAGMTLVATSREQSSQSIWLWRRG